MNEDIVEIDYTNYRGERSLRRIQPKKIRFESTEWHPEPQWLMEALDLGKNETRYFAIKDIHSWKPARDVRLMERAVAWLRGDDTGTSSETILEVMTGIPVKRHSIPWDPADFGRCHRLLKAFPEWEARLGEVAARFPEWKPLVDNWPKMKELYDRDEPTERSPDLYDLMMTLRGEKPRKRDAK